MNAIVDAIDHIIDIAIEVAINSHYCVTLLWTIL